MGNLKAGFAKININPPLGMGIDGYYIPRFGKGFLDDLEASAIVVSLNDTKIAFLSIDNLGIYASDVEKYLFFCNAYPHRPACSANHIF